MAYRRRTTTRRTYRGRGIFDKVKNWLKGAHNFIKDNKYVSGTLRKLGYDRAATAAETYGYGRRRRRRTIRGRGLWDKVKNWVKGAHSFIKDNKYVSGTLRKLGYERGAKAAETYGYGRRRRRTTRGRGLLSVIRAPLSLMGLGRRRRRTTRGRGWIGRTAGGILGGLLPF